MNKKPATFLRFALLFSCLFVLSCGLRELIGRRSSVDASVGDQIIPSQAGTSASFYVYAKNGGSYILDSGTTITLEVPPGALSDDAVVEVSVIDSSRNTDQYAERQVIGPLIALQPSGMEFQSPLRISIDTSTLGLGDIGLDTIQFYTSDDDGDVEPLETTADGDILSAALTHFSLVYLRLREGCSLFGGSEFTSDSMGLGIENGSLVLTGLKADVSVHLLSYLYHNLDYPPNMTLMYQIQLFRKESIFKDTCLITKQSYRVIYNNLMGMYRFEKSGAFSPVIDSLTKPVWNINMTLASSEWALFGREMVVTFVPNGSVGAMTVFDTEGPFDTTDTRDRFLREVFSPNIRYFIRLADLDSLDEVVNGLDLDQEYFFRVKAFIPDWMFGNSNEVTSRTFTLAQLDVPSDIYEPSISVGSPTSATTYTTSSATVNLGGTSTDNVGVTQVSWVNDRGGGGVASGTTNWTISGIALYVGLNQITVTARDAAGNQGNDIIGITYTPPDTEPPVATINTPTSATTYATSGATVNLGGTSADNVGVTQVSWVNDRGGSGVASGTTNWTISGIALYVGLNQITVTARDAANYQGSDSLLISYSPVDTTPPSVISANPSSDVTNVSIYSSLTVTFSEEILGNTISASSFVLKDSNNNSIAGAVYYANASATFIPTDYLEYSMQFTATITTAVKDLAGNRMAGNFVWSFGTEDQYHDPWTVQIGTSEWDSCTDMVVDNSGNLYLAGYTAGDLGAPTLGNNDCLLLTMDSSGNLTGATQFGTTDDEEIRHLATDGSSAVYGTGYTNSSYLDIDQNPQTYGTAFVFVKELTGAMQIKQFGSSSWIDPCSICRDPYGNIYITGNNEGKLDSIEPIGDYDVFVMKFNSSLERQWTRIVGTTAVDLAFDIKADSNGDVYIAGYTQGNFAAQNAGAEDIIIAKYSSSGVLQWKKQIGTGASDAAFDIAIDRSSDYVYVVGWTEGNLDGITNAGSYDSFIMKFDAAGNKYWTQLLGSPMGDKLETVFVDAFGNIYLAGGSWGNIDGYTNRGSDDAYVAKYNPNGTRIWSRLFGSEESEWVSGLYCDSIGNLYAAGFTTGGLDGNTNMGLTDIFVLKYDLYGNKK